VIGKMLATQPKVILLDEPSRVIDIGAKAEVFKLLSERAKQGLAVIYSTSEPNSADILPRCMKMMRCAMLRHSLTSDVE
ncbi:sugar ABC transporter ATP-binding protein, partial [Rhizobium ruizarguesonis]